MQITKIGRIFGMKVLPVNQHEYEADEPLDQADDDQFSEALIYSEIL